MKRVFARAFRRRASGCLCLSDGAGRALALLVASALLNLSASGAYPHRGARAYAGELTVVGGATIDGSPAASGQTIFTGSAVATAADSSSVVDLGGLGRVELAAETSLALDFGEAGAACSLEAGRVRVYAPAGAGSAVRTADAAVSGDARASAIFSVAYAGGATTVAVQSGRVEVKAGESLRRLAAGESFTSAPAPQPPQQNNLSGRKRAGLLVAIATAIAVVVIVLAAKGDETPQVICPSGPIILSGQSPPCIQT